MNGDGGECLACARLNRCSLVTKEKVLESFTCPLFEAVPEAVYVARLEVMAEFGEAAAVKAMIREPEPITQE